jgi:hypothetical protein
MKKLKSRKGQLLRFSLSVNNTIAFSIGECKGKKSISSSFLQIKVFYKASPLNIPNINIVIVRKGCRELVFFKKNSCVVFTSAKKNIEWLLIPYFEGRLLKT